MLLAVADFICLEFLNPKNPGCCQSYAVDFYDLNKAFFCPGEVSFS
jgi:predicted membrane-bound spermidine synthase